MESLKTKKETLKKSWEQAFRKREINFNDNFFEIGGHSLIAAKISSILKKEYEIDVKITDILNFPTITLLAMQIVSKDTSKKHAYDPFKYDRSKIYPLSLSQYRLWFLYKLNPKLAIYSYPVSMLVQGNLDICVFREALNCLMRRHESLRTKVKIINDRPFQEILSLETSFPFKYENISKKQLEKKLSHENSLPFDLEKNVLCRCLVLSVSSNEWVINLNFHHIIFDDWSLDVFSKELKYFYEHLLNNQKIEISSLPYQYIDFTMWQYRRLSTQEIFEQELAYWKKELQNTNQLRLPHDHIRPKMLTYKGSILNVTIPQSITEELHKIAQQENVSLFILLLTCFNWAISIFSNSEDILIGCPISNRPFSSQESVIGYFINTLVFRTIFSKEETFHVILQRVKRKVLEAYKNQETPFEKIVDSLKIPRELNRNPLFQIMFSIEYESEISSFDLENAKLIRLNPQHYYSKFDVSLHAVIKSQSIELKFEYSQELFKKSTIQDLSNYCFSIFNEIIKNQYTDLSSINKKIIPYRAVKQKIGSGDFFPEKTPLCVLDTYKNPLPKNAIGEIYAGPSVQLGKSSKFTNFTGSGLYGRYVSDNEIEILGNIENSVKVEHGSRIFFMEIEKALTSHPNIIDALVKKIIKDNENVLEIYIQLLSKFSPESTEIIDYLSKKVGMQISIKNIYFSKNPIRSKNKLTNINKMILLKNHKLQLSKKYLDMEIQNKLLLLWQQVLNVKEIEIDETFFDLGGNSFKVIQLCGLIQEKLNISITPVDLFQYPTLEKLTSCCTQNIHTSNLREQAKMRRLQFLKSIKS